MKAINSMISANDVAKETAIENDIVEILNSIVAAEAPGLSFVENKMLRRVYVKKTQTSLQSIQLTTLLVCGVTNRRDISANDHENAQEIKANAYALLSTLVEQSNMLSEFYDKASSSGKP